MKKILRKMGVTCGLPLCSSFLKLNPNSELLSQVEYLLVDPPCSNPEEREISQKRIRSLSAQQSRFMCHAFNFPNVKRIIYTTTSPNVQENEEIVKCVLDEIPGIFRVIEAFPKWHVRGKPEFDFGHLCVRVQPFQDLTRGLFVAVLERIVKPPNKIEDSNRLPFDIEMRANPSKSCLRKNTRKKTGKIKVIKEKLNQVIDTDTVEFLHSSKNRKQFKEPKIVVSKETKHHETNYQDHTKDTESIFSQSCDDVDNLKVGILKGTKRKRKLRKRHKRGKQERAMLRAGVVWSTQTKFSSKDNGFWNKTKNTNRMEKLAHSKTEFSTLNIMTKNQEDMIEIESKSRKFGDNFGKVTFEVGMEGRQRDKHLLKEKHFLGKRKRGKLRNGISNVSASDNIELLHKIDVPDEGNSKEKKTQKRKDQDRTRSMLREYPFDVLDPDFSGKEVTKKTFVSDGSFDPLRNFSKRSSCWKYTVDEPYSVVKEEDFTSRVKPTKQIQKILVKSVDNLSFREPNLSLNMNTMDINSQLKRTKIRKRLRNVCTDAKDSTSFNKLESGCNSLESSKAWEKGQTVMDKCKTTILSRMTPLDMGLALSAVQF